MKQYIALSLVAILTNTSMLYSDSLNTSSLNKSIQKEKEDILLVTINGHEIWQSYFDKSFSALSSKEKNKKIQDIINAELLVQYASKDKIFNDKELHVKVREHGDSLKEQGRKFTDQDYRMVLGLTAINRIADRESNITEEEVKRYYQKRKNNFKHLPFVDFIELTFSSKEEAKRTLEILKKVKKSEKKATFLALAKKYTKSNRKSYIKREYKFGIPKNSFTLKLFSLKRGEYTQKVIEMEDKSYKLIYCVDSGFLKKVPKMEELDNNIRFIIRYKNRLAWINSKLEELKKDAKIDIKKRF